MRGRAAAAGALAARRRQYDEWSFTGPVAYLEGIRRERDQAIAENAAGACAGEERIREAVAQQQRAERASRESTEERLGKARRDRDLARRREEITLEGLDILAGAWAPRQRPGWDDEDPAEHEEREAAEAGAGQDGRPGREDVAGPPDSASGATPFAEPDEAILEGRLDSMIGPDDTEEPDEAAPGATRRTRDRGRRASRRIRWMGAADGRTAMAMPTWLKIGILVALIAAEGPIYYISFQTLHPRRDLTSVVQTTLLSASVAIVMVLGPHLAGTRFRRRHELPVEGLVSYLLVGSIMLLWFVGALLFGWFRQAVLLAPAVDPVTGQNVGGFALTDSWVTMTVVFAVVLLLSGLIAFLLGGAEHHPAIAAFQAAVQDRQEKDEAYLRAVGDQAQTIESTIISLEHQLEAHWRAAEERERAIWAEHQAAQCDYLDAVALGMGQPTLTEAVTAAILDESPPDPPVVRLARELRTAEPTAG